MTNWTASSVAKLQIAWFSALLTADCNRLCLVVRVSQCTSVYLRLGFHHRGLALLLCSPQPLHDSLGSTKVVTLDSAVRPCRGNVRCPLPRHKSNREKTWVITGDCLWTGNRQWYKDEKNVKSAQWWFVRSKNVEILEIMLLVFINYV